MYILHSKTVGELYESLWVVHLGRISDIISSLIAELVFVRYTGINRGLSIEDLSQVQEANT